MVSRRRRPVASQRHVRHRWPRRGGVLPGRHPPPRRSTPSPSFPRRTPREPRPEAHARLEPAPQSEYEPARAPSSSDASRVPTGGLASVNARGPGRRRSRRRPRARSVCGPARPSTRHPNRHPNRQPNAHRHLRPRSKPSSRPRASFRSRVAPRRAPCVSSRVGTRLAGGGVYSRGRVRVRPIRVETPRRARARLLRRRNARLDAPSPPRVVRRRVDGVLARFARGDTG